MEFLFLFLGEGNCELGLDVLENFIIADVAISGEDVQARAGGQGSEQGQDEDPEHSLSSSSAEAVGVEESQTQGRGRHRFEEESPKKQDGHPSDTDSS